MSVYDSFITVEYELKLLSTGDTFAHEADSIWRRTTTLEPSLNVPETEILATFAGLRPGRLGGARIEKEARAAGRIVVHNYGAGGTGYQAGFGMAVEAVGLALPSLKDLTSGSNIVSSNSAEHGGIKAKL